MTNSAPVILVVGGVAGGASAATRARRMNEHARIVLFEKDAHVSFANCGLPYHVGGEIPDREKLLVAKPALFADRFDIDVRERHEVTSIDRTRKTIRVTDAATGRASEEHYDKLILAPGATPVVPPIPGAASRGVFTLRNLDDADRIVAALCGARRAVVVGGGFIGLETAEQLRTRGLDVTLVEREAQVLPVVDAEMAEPLHRELESRGVRLELGRGIAEVEATDGAATGVRLADGTRIPADLVVLGLGVRPNTSLASAAGLAIGASGGIATDEHMRTSDSDVYAVGDAAEYAVGATGRRGRVALAGPANRTGRLAGEHAATGGGRDAPAAWGTAIVRVFGKTSGITGLSLRAARSAGLDAHSVHVTANHHAGYFPGAESMVLKLVYETATGRVLGAQATGGQGVDKRLDVVATTLHHRGTVHDLAQLDLAYAPPFGSAKDPVHLAAFVAQNDLAGVARVLAPDADLSAYQVVDCRSAEEIARLPLAAAPHAVNIPTEELRRRIGELDHSRPTVVACRTGQRSHVGTRILAQRGFREVWNLSGGASVRDLALNRRTPPTSVPAATPTAADEIPAPQFASLLATKDVDVLDVRTGAEFRAAHLPVARHAPLDALDAEDVKAGRAATSRGPTYVVCKGGSRARMAATKLRAAGVPCVVVAGGLEACIAAGILVDRDSRVRVWPIERQVRLIAGLLVLTGVALGAFVHPIGYGLAAFVGAGLTFAGATDVCGMALLLGRCSWNR
jgi:NADPH-dependent 2,4-dienoyl-CoA reductase/sulfur reductase-like enzyme/rhodanese-related sulfurtransferase